MRNARPVCAALCFGLALGLTACSYGSTSDGPAQITVWDVYGASSPLDKVVPEFEQQHPNIDVELVKLPFDNLYDKLAVGATGGTLPDVATVGLLWAPQYTQLGIYADLSPYAEGEINGEPLEDVYPPGMIEGAIVDGSLYGIPYDFDAYSLYYREDMLAEAGIDEPPQTWEELVTKGKELTKDTNGDGKVDQYAFMSQLNWEHWEPFLRANGGDFLSEDNTQATFNSPEAVESLQFFSDLFNRHEIALAWTEGMGDPTKGIKAEDFAMFMNGPFMMGQMRESVPEQEGAWRVSSPLKHKTLGTHIGGTYLSAFATSDYEEEAWKFIEFASRKENAAIVAEEAAPAYLPAAEESSQEPDEYFGGTQPMQTFLDISKTGDPNPTVEKWQQIADILDDAVEEAVVTNNPPKPILDEAASEVDQLLSK